MAQPATTPQSGVTSPASGIPASPAPAQGSTLRFQVVQDQSKATFRVREQLAGVNFPSDAVGTTGNVTGEIRVSPSGKILSEGSKISVDLRTLKSDDARRDNYIKGNTLATNRFPTAEFVATSADSLPNPVPASGEQSFRLTGQMTVHGVTTEVTWDVSAKRDGGSLTGTGTTSVKFGDFGMTPPRVPLVLSVTDDIHLQIDLAATQVS